MNNPQKLQKLLQELLANKKELPERGQRTHDKNSWYLNLIHKYFPGEECVSLGACIKLLVKKHVNTVKSTEVIAPLLEEIAPFVNVSKEQFYSDLRTKVFGHKSEAIRAEAQKVLKTTQIEKKIQNRKAKDNLNLRLANQIELTEDRVYTNIVDGLNSHDIYELGIALETAIGTRSIDIASKHVANFKLAGDYVEITGYSKDKEKNTAKRKINQTTPRLVRPVGITADQFIHHLKRYRNSERIANTIERFGEDNSKISTYLNKGLSEVVKELYPEQKALHGRSGSHLTRAINFQLGYNAFAKPNESKFIFGKRSLHHSDFASIPNYDAVAVRSRVEEGPVNIESKLNELEARLGAFEQQKPVPQEASRKRKEYTIPSNYVELEKSNGDDIQLPKFKRMMTISDTALQERCQEGFKLLQTSGVATTNTNLRKLGIGAKSVNALFKSKVQ